MRRDEIHGNEPLNERNLRILKDCANKDRKVPSTNQLAEYYHSAGESAKALEFAEVYHNSWFFVRFSFYETII